MAMLTFRKEQQRQLLFQFNTRLAKSTSYHCCRVRKKTLSGFAMNLIWGMMNDLSFIISLGMISIPIPGIASPIQSLLSTIIYMDLLMTDKWLSNFLEDITQISEDDEDAPLNLFLGSQGFQSKLLLFNLGSTLVFFIIQVLLLIYTGIMRLLSQKCLRAMKQYEFLEKRLIWGGTIRFIIQQSQPLIFSSLINLKATSLSDLKDSSIGIGINFYLSTVIFAGTLISIVVFFVIIKQGTAGDNRYSTLIEGLNSKQSNFAKYWTVWILTKWTLMCFVLILLTDYPGQQLTRPMDSRIDNAICLFNELMASIYLHVLIGLTIASEDIELRENLGLALISILLFSLFVNILKVFIMIGIEIVKKAKQKLCSQSDKVIHLRNNAKKYEESPLSQIENLEEEKEELKVEIKIKHNLTASKFTRYVRKKKNQTTNEPALESHSQTIINHDVTLQEFT
ncbi:hypothetical protein FGO68_gene11197 [Halteria grandinella]|uniref:Uncharacterized protein n=1 Tax=Halteria grandinella TaxID=5974 RepID=A0A8J8T9H0_HALGN|nr:hypothetical protein FGO68_gene11197 [Halteria grandinella]